MNHTSPNRSRFAGLATPELSESRACARRAEAIMLLPFAGISTIHADQTDTLAALQIKKPSLDAQMSLL